MAVSPQLQDWVLRELVTSNKMNNQIRDVHANSFAYLATAIGSIPYLNATREVGILAPPTVPSVLTSSGGIPSWRTLGAFIVPGTITEDMIKDQSVSEPKLKIQNEPVSGRFIQAHQAGMRWDVAEIRVIQIGQHTDNQNNDPQRWRETLTVDNPDQYIAFFMRVNYGRLVDNNSGGSEEPVFQIGPIYRDSFAQVSGGGNQASMGNFDLIKTSTTIRVEVNAPQRRQRGNRSRVPAEFTLFGVRQQIS